MPTVIDKNLPLIKDICADHSVRSLFLFGSLAKGAAGRSSDVDLLVDFQEIPFGSYADNMLGFEEGLKKALKSPIDLTTARFMRNRFFIQSVEESKILLYSMEKETLKLLEDIRMAADIIDESLERLMGKERNYFLYEKDLVLQGSVERRLLIVGEALTKLRKVNPAIEVSHSSKIIGLRNRLAHAYDAIDNIQVWEIIVKHLPVLQSEIVELIEKLEKGG